MTSHYCPSCQTNWWPSHTRNGACPACASGTQRSPDAPDADAPERHRAIREREAKYEAFERYYAAREARRTMVA